MLTELRITQEKVDILAQPLLSCLFTDYNDLTLAPEHMPGHLPLQPVQGFGNVISFSGADHSDPACAFPGSAAL